MKTIKLLLILTFALAAHKSGNAQAKHALIFAIGDYPKEGGWSKIASTTDVKYIKSMLNKQGFVDNNVKIITDAAATKTGIVSAIDELIKKVKKDDIVLIHFSSHGQQVADNNADESDGYDETIVPYDAVLPLRGVKVTEAEYKKIQLNYFRDDEFGSKIEELRGVLKGNGDVIVFIDACHSGSGTRGLAKVRGGQPAIAPEGYNPQNAKKEVDEVFREGNKSINTETSLATYVVFSAALAEELNYETTGDDNQDMGSLTYAISKAFANLEAGITYRSLFAKMQAVMNEKVPGQHPVLEGNGLDRLLFGGKFVQQMPYIEIDQINNPKEITLKAGLFAGLDSGAKVAIYPSGTADPSKVKPLGQGTIKKAGNYVSTAALDNALTLSQAASGWVFVTDPVFRLKPIGIAFEGKMPGEEARISFSDSETKNMKEALSTLPLLNLSIKPDLLIIKGKGTDSIKIADNGYVFSTIKNAGTDTAGLKREISRYAQFRFLQSLNIADPLITAQVKLIPVINGRPDTSFITSPSVNRPYEFSVGDQFVLWINNTSQEDVYVNILDIQPDGRINPIIPNTKIRSPVYPKDLRISAGTSRLYDKYIITLGPPLGMETFKVFVSTQEINMEGLADPDTQSRGNLKMLETLVKKSADIATRGGSGENLDNAEGSAYNLLFRIKAKN